MTKSKFINRHSESKSFINRTKGHYLLICQTGVLSLGHLTKACQEITSATHTDGPRFTYHRNTVCRKPYNFSFTLSNEVVDIVGVRIIAIRFTFFEADVRTFEIRIIV